jgi:hypothetical protein
MGATPGFARTSRFLTKSLEAPILELLVNGDLLRLQFDAFELDEQDARLTRAGQPVALAAKAFAVLCALRRA